MTFESVFNYSAILCGGIIILVSIIKAKGVLAVAPLIAEKNRDKVVLFVRLHRLLMFFFLFGYLIVMLSFIFEFTVVNRAFVSIIFLLGAVFVLLGVMVQARLLSEIQLTLRGLLPICMDCKKMRVEKADPKDRESWKAIETFISERSDVDFSHGYCPDCAVKAIDRAEAEIAAEDMT